LAAVGLRELARPANAPPPELRVPPGEAWAALQARHPRWTSLLLYARANMHVLTTAPRVSSPPQARHPRWASLLLEHGVHVTKTVRDDL
jgi:hypothetical protein